MRALSPLFAAGALFLTLGAGVPAYAQDAAYTELRVRFDEGSHLTFVGPSGSGIRHDLAASTGSTCDPSILSDPTSPYGLTLRLFRDTRTGGDDTAPFRVCGDSETPRECEGDETQTPHGTSRPLSAFPEPVHHQQQERADDQDRLG